MSDEKKYLTVQDLPGPKGLPIIGNLLQLDLPKLHLIMEKWADQYGDRFKFKLANKNVIGISNTDLIHIILRERPKKYRRVSTIENVARELKVNGLLTSEGDLWRRQRYITSQAFKSECLRRFFPAMQQIIGRLYDRWNNYAIDGSIVDVKKEWMLFTVDITTNFAFGYDINLLENESNSFQKHLEKQLPGFNRRVNAPFPYWHYFKLPSDYALENSLIFIKKLINSFVVSARQRLDKDLEKENYQPTNFLEAILLSKDEDGTGFSDEEIQGNIYNILMAGEDTTAHTLSWALYFMAKNPDIQNKMQKEVDIVLEHNRIPSDLESLEKLTYIEAVANETLRLKGAAPLLFLEANIDVELDGLKIPKETLIMLINRYGGLQENNFTHALQFYPERWIELKRNKFIHNHNASIPFGGGTRSCPGRNLSMMEMKMALAMVCKNFTVSRFESERPVQEVFSFTMMPDNLKVRFERRNAN